ncbi:Mrp family chromosome partitioning ATPase [Actinomadura pelletieri DSM 43383]|uniref:Mrp family chromosome partitioning ATPase n=1 Tax=Actinomadura pelletieri DSM 43383 TaxID=1120940 RepID=A0A495QIT7_9ACTN|nr:hypothetical protein [Actinomadura pelletieri]RKS72072.1 Mrp family chromosome partitioning ATPase [Actinomadura pelletieri DSM 43383]
MAADQAADPQGGQLLSLVRRYTAALIVLGVLGAGAGIVLEIAVPPPYKATATVLVSPLEGNPYSPEGRGDDLVNLQTEAQLVATDGVAKIVEKKLGHEPDGKVAVSVPPNTQVLNLTYTTSDSGRARAGAQAFADAYLEYRKQRAQGVVNNQLAKLKAQAEKVELQLQQANRELVTLSGAKRATLAQRITAYTNQLGVIDEQSNDIASTPVDPGQVITPADAPGGPGLIRPAMYGTGGLILGLVAGFAVMLLRERLNQRLRNAEAIEGLGLRALATIPAGGPGGDTLALVSAPKSPVGEAYRRLRAAVVATAPQTPTALLVSNATPGGSARLASANLAVSLAFAGAKTIMIDATTEDADMTGLFGARPGKGLSDTLLSGTDPATLLIHTDSQLRLLPRGPRAREAAHRFSGPRMREAVKVLRRRSEYLVINAASLHDADAQALCTFADAVILVVNQGVTTKEELRQAYVEAERAGVTVLGALLEPAEQRGARPARQLEPPRQGRPTRGGWETRAQTEAPPLGWGDDQPGPEDPRAPDSPEDGGYWPGRLRDEDEDADSASLTTQALPQLEQGQPKRQQQIKPQPWTGDPRQSSPRQPRHGDPRRGGPPQGSGRRGAPLSLEPPASPGKPVAPKPVSPTDVTQGVGQGEPTDAERAEAAAALESAATRTQEDISKYMPPEPPEGKDGPAAPKGPSDAAPGTGRYGKQPHKTGRHAGS